MRRATAEAVALGLLHGPVELLPVSSSAHVEALPWLLRWEVAGWDGEARKELEVALHAGTAAALLGLLGRDWLRGGRTGFRLAAVTPAGLAGLELEKPIERRLRGSRVLASGLLAGASALALADAAPQLRPATRAGWRDGLWLGAAQACALVPGVSRSGATLAAARARGFDRAASSALSWEAGLPILLGASALKAFRLARSGGWHRRGPTLAAAAGAATASTLVTAGSIGFERRGPLWRWAAWRALLAASILAVGENRRRD